MCPEKTQGYLIPLCWLGLRLGESKKWRLMQNCKLSALFLKANPQQITMSIWERIVGLLVPGIEGNLSPLTS